MPLSASVAVGIAGLVVASPCRLPIAFLVDPSSLLLTLSCVRIHVIVFRLRLDYLGPSLPKILNLTTPFAI